MSVSQEYMQICSNKERNAAAATAKKKLIALGHGWQTQQQQLQHRQHQQQQGAPFNRARHLIYEKVRVAYANCLLSLRLLLLLLLLLLFLFCTFFGLQKLQQSGY